MNAPPEKLWLWKNFVDGRPEYWAFDNPFPIGLDHHDPQTLGEPVGYAIVMPSRPGRTDVTDEEILRAIRMAKGVKAPSAPPGYVPDEMVSRFLTWRLPDDFYPDRGIQLTAVHPNGKERFEPVGTNLFTAEQARKMLEHVLAVAPKVSAPLLTALDIAEIAKQCDIHHLEHPARMAFALQFARAIERRVRGET